MTKRPQDLPPARRFQTSGAADQEEAGNAPSPAAQALPAISLSNLPEGLGRLGEDLKETCRGAEPDFMELGRSLQQVFSDARDLMEKTKETVSLLGGGADRSVLVRVDDLVKQAMTELKSCQTEVSDNLKQVNLVTDHLGSLNRMCAGLERIALFLKVVGLNMGIESARTAKTGDMFTVIAQEIKKHSEKVVHVAESIRRDVREARGRQAKVSEKINAGLVPLRRLSDEVRETVQSSVGEIEKIMGLSLNTLNAAAGRSSEIARQIGEIVVGVQFHDSMTQRVDHIAKAVDDVRLLCDVRKKETDMAEGREERLGTAYAITGLQAAQLRQVIEEIDGVRRSSSEALGEIREQIDALVETLSDFGVRKEARAPDAEGLNADLFESLKAALMRLKDLLAKGRDMAAEIRRSTAEASDASANLMGHMDNVRNISFETHLLALNAIVKAAHLGEEGRTLEVLSQEMKSLSVRTGEFVGEAEARLSPIDAAVQQLQRMTSAENRTRTGDAETVTFLDRGIREVIDAYARFKSNCSDIFETAEGLSGTIARARGGLDFMKALAGALQVRLEKMEAAENLLISWRGKGNQAVIAEAEKLAERYSMHRERQIHAEFNSKINQANAVEGLELFDRAEAEDAGRPPAADEDDDPLENWALEPPGEADETAAEEDASQGRADEAAGAEPAPGKKDADAEDAPASPDPDEADFGDNVELF